MKLLSLTLILVNSINYLLFSAHDAQIKSQECGVIRTDLQIKVPDGTYARIAPRSGLALNYQLNVLGNQQQ
jgi:dUTP pyrophosphatase